MPTYFRGWLSGFVECVAPGIELRALHIGAGAPPQSCIPSPPLWVLCKNEGAVLHNHGLK